MDNAQTSRYEIRPVDPAAFSTHRICELRHNFQDHPLMQLPQLARLAKDLYGRNFCRFIKPGATQASAFDHESQDHFGRDIDQVFARIEEPGSWIALYQVENDPTYRAFLDEVMSTVMPLVDREQPGTYLVNGFIFISAPPSVTPFHIDRENNFWLQVRGRKILNVWDHRDRDVVPARTIEDFLLYGGGCVLDESLVPRSVQADMGPGDGMYWPSTSPHMTRSDRSWTRPGDGVSISIGVNFYTPHLRRQANIRAWNSAVRRLGLEPREPGASALDPAKYALGRGLVWAKRKLRGFEPKPGF
jgi:hypothetical protein